MNTSNEREVINMKRLTFAECPKTRKEFVSKFKTDPIFRARAQFTGFDVIFDCVKLPNGKVAGKQVK